MNWVFSMWKKKIHYLSSSMGCGLDTHRNRLKSFENLKVTKLTTEAFSKHITSFLEKCKNWRRKCWCNQERCWQRQKEGPYQKKSDRQVDENNETRTSHINKESKKIQQKKNVKHVTWRFQILKSAGIRLFILRSCCAAEQCRLQGVVERGWNFILGTWLWCRSHFSWN